MCLNYDAKVYKNPELSYKSIKNIYKIKKIIKKFGENEKKPYLCTRKTKGNGAIAQLVEHRTENPCVPGSNPGGTTKKTLTNL